MTRRTRRNLSDPKIKHIVKHQIQISQSQVSFTVNTYLNLLFKRLFFTIFIIFVLFFGYSLLTNFDLKFDSFLNNFRSSQRQINNPSDQSQIPAKIEESKIAATEKTEADNTSVIEPVQRKLQVEVLNGCGAGGIASEVTKYLRANDIDVVKSDNYTRFDIQKTVVWRRVEKTDPAQKVAALLGLSYDDIVAKLDPNLQLDVTIILGADYQTLKPFKK